MRNDRFCFYWKNGVFFSGSLILTSTVSKRDHDRELFNVFIRLSFVTMGTDGHTLAAWGALEVSTFSMIFSLMYRSSGSSSSVKRSTLDCDMFCLVMAS